MESLGIDSEELHHQSDDWFEQRPEIIEIRKDERLDSLCRKIEEDPTLTPDQKYDLQEQAWERRRLVKLSQFGV